MIPLPRIALVGRPNVGKSTLFNRICGRRKAITDGRPGSTRDRNYAQASWQGRAFELVDTGGLLLGSRRPAPRARRRSRPSGRSRRRTSLLFLVDGRAGLLPDDEAIARRLRRAGKRVLVVVNKTESREEDLSEFARLGFDGAHFVSAEHGQGIGDLLDAALEGLPSVVARAGRGRGRSPSRSSAGRTSGSRRSSTACSGASARSSRPSRGRRATPWTRCSSARAGATASWTPPASARCASSRRTSTT